MGVEKEEFALNTLWETQLQIYFDLEFCLVTKIKPWVQSIYKYI